MPQSQSQPTTTQAPSKEARSYLCYEFKKGAKISRTRTPILPYQSNMVDDDGSLLSTLHQANNENRPINKETAWQTKVNHPSLAPPDVAQKVVWSLRTGEKVTRLAGSFALIADGKENVGWWMKETAADGSIVPTSGAHYPEEPEREDWTETDETVVGK